MSQMTRVLFFLCFGWSMLVECAVPQDLVIGKDLPHWNKDFNSQIYSGFLKLSANEKRLHYVFVECENDPKNAPLVLWLNGGPGCSSLEGFFYEHGPLNVADAHAPPNINHAGDASPGGNSSELVSNPWSWSRTANVLYIEAPAGVGFSYPADEKTGDNLTATDNLEALNVFFKAFPEFSKNPFYVSGESYGGVYVPTLSLKIYQAGKNFLGNMQGYLVGNGVFDFEDAVTTRVPFSYGHGFISDSLHDQILAACPSSYQNVSKACKTLLAKADSMQVNVNGYDAYRTCYQPKQDGGRSSSHLSELVDMFGSDPHQRVGLYKKLTETVPCINTVKGTAFLNEPAVRRALHVDESPNKWQICGGVNYQDDNVYKSMVAVHKEILASYSPRVLVYNGDVDPGCNYLWAQRSVEKFGLAVKEEWRPWVYADQLVGQQLGGFVTTYDRDTYFVTVHGAGHMSPQWRPEAVFHMLQHFLNNSPL